MTKVCIQTGISEELSERFIESLHEIAVELTSADDADILFLDHDTDFFVKSVCGFQGSIFTFLPSGEIVKVK
jgi:hypothetical protein